VKHAQRENKKGRRKYTKLLIELSVGDEELEIYSICIFSKISIFTHYPTNFFLAFVQWGLGLMIQLSEN
jgi:hypothetical protein